VEHIVEWISLYANNPAKLSVIRDFAYGIIISQFRRDLWTKAKSPSADPEILAKGDLAFTYDNARTFAAPFCDLYIDSPNLAFDRSDFHNYLEYIFGSGPWASSHKGKTRQRNKGLMNMLFYLAYGAILEAIQKYLSPPIVAK